MYFVNVNWHGSIFDGQFSQGVDAFARHSEKVVGEEAVSRIRRYLPTQYKYLGHNGGDPRFNPVPHDAGLLEASIESHRVSTDLYMVTGDNVIYGPWIEGVAWGNWIVYPHRRNPPPRRFPGYHTFRIISQELQVEAADIAEREYPMFKAIIDA